VCSDRSRMREWVTGSMLKVQNIEKWYGSIQAVRGISFEAEKGEILGFLGPNGAGKTTTMRMVVGFIPPSSGSATVCGYDVQEEPVLVKKQIGYLPENAPVYADMTVRGFLLFVAEIRGYRGKEKKARVDSAMEKCRLGSEQHRTIGTLSKGYRQRVCFAQAILHDPPVLIMDEPTDGLDPNQKFVVREMIKAMASEKAIVISTHILEEVEAVCTRAIIISRGAVVANGSPAELKAKSKSGRLEDVFRKVTLGEEHASGHQ
jgi:ABC-2 type transport system ATP-binding protein